MRVAREIDSYYWTILASAAAIVAIVAGLTAALADNPGPRFLVLGPIALALAVRFLHKEEGLDIRSHRGTTPGLMVITTVKLLVVFAFSLGLTYLVALVGQVLLFPLFR